MSNEEIALGTGYIKKWIPAFSYSSMIKNTITLFVSLVKSYKNETCNFFKLQLFRTILEIDDNRVKITDDHLLNHIDQTYHVENDYVYTLDFRNFEMIPISLLINVMSSFLHNTSNKIHATIIEKKIDMTLFQ